LGSLAGGVDGEVCAIRIVGWVAASGEGVYFALCEVDVDRFAESGVRRASSWVCIRMCDGHCWVQRFPNLLVKSGLQELKVCADDRPHARRAAAAVRRDLDNMMPRRQEYMRSGQREENGGWRWVSTATTDN